MCCKVVHLTGPYLADPLLADLLIGLDVGTTATKALLLDPEGRVLASAGRGYGLLTPRPGWVGQDPEEIWRAVVETLAVNHIQDGYIRLIVTRGQGTLGLDADLCSNPQVVIITDHLALYPEAYYRDGLEIVTASTQRNHPAALNPRIKSLNYLNNIMAKLEGLRAGCVEALMLNHKGEVAECTGDNIFVVRSGVLLTPPPDAGILEGITRNAVMELAHTAGIDCREATLTRHDLYTADECFLTGTAAEVIPVVDIDGRTIGSGTPGPITSRGRPRRTRTG